MKKHLILTNRYFNSLDPLPLNNLLMLGEWCKVSKNEKNNLEEVDVSPYHWLNRKKRAKDSIFINKFYEKVLDKLVNKLNKIHKLNFSKRSWRIFIGPWLITYITAIFDRWESINSVLSSNEEIIFVLDANLKLRNPNVPSIFSSARDLYAFSQEYNEMLFTRVLEFKYPKNKRIFYRTPENKKSHINQINYKNLYLENNLNAIKIVFHKFKEYFWSIRSFFFGQKFIFYKTHINRWTLIKLFLKFNQIPNRYPEFNQKVQQKSINNKVRSVFFNEEYKSSEFESFFWIYFGQDIPTAYLEDLNYFKTIAKRIIHKPKLIFTANGYWENEVFKFWVSYLLSNNKTKLVVKTHGGGFPECSSTTLTFKHEVAISDLHLTSHKPISKNQLQFPKSNNSSRLSGKSIGFRKSRKAKFITLVGSGQPLFAHRSCPFPMSSCILNDFDQKIKFIDELGKDLFEVLKIRPYPDQGWHISKKYSDRYGDKIIDKNKSYLQTIQESKLIICGYPQTTYGQAMNSGKPTIILFKSEYWEVDKMVNNLVKEMRKENMIFDNPYKAALHVQNVENDLDHWWGRKNIQDLIEEFHRLCSKKSDKPVTEFESLLRYSINN